MDNYDQKDELGLFLTEESINLDVDYARSYVNSDTDFRIILYRVNLIESKVDDLYGESLTFEKKVQPPIYLSVLNLTFGNSEQTYMADVGIVREDINEMNFNIFINELKEKNTDINRGDYVSYNMSGEKERFFEVTYANNVHETTNRTVAGKKAVFRKIVAKPVKEDVILTFK